MSAYPRLNGSPVLENTRDLVVMPLRVTAEAVLGERMPAHRSLADLDTELRDEPLHFASIVHEDDDRAKARDSGFLTDLNFGGRQEPHDLLVVTSGSGFIVLLSIKRMRTST